MFLKIFPLFFFLPLLLFGQVRTNVVNVAAGESLENYIPHHENTPLDEVQLMPPVDVAAALAAHDSAGRQAQLYGVPILVDLSKADGDTTDLGGIIIWRLSIRSNEAVSLNFHLSDLSLPLGSELYIYNQAGTMVSGPVTSTHVYDGQYATDIISGEEVYLEAIVRKSSFEAFNVAVSTVVHGFQDLEANDRGYGDSQTCNVDVNCPVGAGFGNERDAVCLISNANGELCSGVLISDDCQSLRSFLLTAKHCVNGEDVANWVFRFNYDSPNPTTPACRGSNATNWLTYSGSSIKAQSSATDFALLELNGSVVGQPTLALAGWDRSSNPTITSVVCIHHAHGDVKKISVDADILSGTPGFWHVDDWATGTTEDGIWRNTAVTGGVAWSKQDRRLFNSPIAEKILVRNPEKLDYDLSLYLEKRIFEWRFIQTGAGIGYMQSNTLFGRPFAHSKLDGIFTEDLRFIDRYTINKLIFPISTKFYLGKFYMHINALPAISFKKSVLDKRDTADKKYSKWQFALNSLEINPGLGFQITERWQASIHYRWLYIYKIDSIIFNYLLFDEPSPEFLQQKVDTHNPFKMWLTVGYRLKK